MLDPTVLTAVRQALLAEPEWPELSQRLEQAAPSGEEEQYRPLVYAFGYDLIERSQHDRRERAQSSFETMISGPAGSWPPRLHEVDDEAVEAWREAAAQLTEPIALARLHDLLWERRVGPRPDKHARGAAAALLAVTDYEHWHLMGRALCLSRALELANAVNDGPLRAQAIDRAVRFVRENLAAETRGPGAVMTLLRALVGLQADHRPEELPPLLRSAAQRYHDDPRILDGLSELGARLADGDERIELRRQQVANWRASAEQDDTMLRVMRLEEALEVARTHGLAEEANQIRRELQEIRPEDLEMQTFSQTMEIPSEELQRWIHSIAGQPDWQKALRHMGSEGPPGGTSDEIDRQLQEERNEFVFLQLVRRSVMGHGTAATRFRADDEETRRSLERSERRAWYARIYSPLYAEALLAIGRRDDLPEHDELTAFFITGLIGPERAERIARALELFWDGQPDESAHILVPRIESIIREIARHSDLPVIREPVGREPGGARSLGMLLLELRGTFPDEDRLDYIYNVLTDPLGLNLRNTIAHGLIDSVGPGDAALLLQVALFLRLLALKPASNTAETDSGDEPPTH